MTWKHPGVEEFCIKGKWRCCFIDVHTCGAAGLGCPMGADLGCSIYNQNLPHEIPPLCVLIGLFTTKSVVTDFFCHSREKFVSTHLKLLL